MGLLRVTSEQLKGAEFILSDESVKVGRSRDNGIRLPHKSVSRHHAVVSEEDGRLQIKDLASTYGCYINEDKISEGTVEDGDVLRLGRIRLTYQTDILAPPPGTPAAVADAVKAKAGEDSIPVERVAVAEPELDAGAPEPIQLPSQASTRSSVETKPCDKHPANNLSLICPKCHLKFCDECVNKLEVSGQERRLCPYCKESCRSLQFHLASEHRSRSLKHGSVFGCLGDVFKFPFSSEGLWLLLIGSIVYVVLDFVAQFDYRVAIVASAYVCAYLVNILRAIAAEEDIPGWPDFTDWWGQIVRPFLMFLTALGAAFLPLIIYGFMAGWEDLRLRVVLPTAAWALLYMPVSLVAITTKDDFTAVNPFVVMPGMIKLHTQYMLTSVILFAMVIGRYFLNNLFDTYINIPVVPVVFGAVVSLYFLIASLRLVGLLHQVNRSDLGWLDK